ncbi:256_t:CDS:1, partial [Acaulospora morrowiae]
MLVSLLGCACFRLRYSRSFVTIVRFVGVSSALSQASGFILG